MKDWLLWGCIFLEKKLLDKNKNGIAWIFEERVTLKYRKNVEFFAFYSPSLNYKCILPDGTYFTMKGQRTENKLVLVSDISEVKLLQTCLFVLCRCAPLHKCNVTYCKCNIASLCNTSWLNMKTIGFEILLLMVYQWYTWLGVSVLASKTLKWSTLLACSIFFCHFKHFIVIITVNVVYQDQKFRFKCLQNIYLLFYKKTMRPYFFCITPCYYDNRIKTWPYCTLF